MVLHTNDIIPFATSTTTPSNGSVTTVKTGRGEALRGAHLSVAALGLHNVAASELQPWEVLRADSDFKAPEASASLKAALTAMPAGSGAMAVRRKGGRRSRGKTVNISVGNDSRIPWLVRPKNLHTVVMSQSVSEQSLSTSSNAAPTYSSITFVVSGLNNFTSMSAVFDEYRILEIECLISPNITEVINQTSGGPGTYVTAVDVDDAGVPTSLDQIASYESSVETKATVSHYHRWEPQYAVAAYSGAFTSYSLQKGWIDCSYPNVQHYGIKFGVGVAGLTQDFTYHYRYRIAFRGVH